MSARWLFICLLLCTVLASPADAAEPTEPLDARVRAGLETTADVWVGQQIGLTVDILSPGSTFSKQRIYLPAVAGALILEDAVTTIYLNERIDGETWQVLRYRYPMFVQRSGTIEVPPVDVAFEVSPGFGQANVAFDLNTQSLSLSVNPPPGVTNLQNLVTTARFTLNVDVTPNKTELQVGDAVTRTITRTATGVSGMAFAPLPEHEIAGVAAYPEAPLIDDSSNRGELRGQRIDTTTFVLQAEGEVDLPAIDLQWWDPQAAQLHVETIPALSLTVAANPALTATRDLEQQTPSGSLKWLYLLAAGVAGVLGWLLNRHLPRLKSHLRHRARLHAQTEPARFKQLQQACRKNDALLAYNAYLHWASADHAPASALLASPPLKAAREKTQQAFITGDNTWRGKALADATQQARRAKQGANHSKAEHELAALNPTETTGIFPS